MTLRVVVVEHEVGERVPLLLDEAGFPIPGPCEWLLDRRQMAANTLMRNARELALFEEWLGERCIDLDDRIRSSRLFTEAELKGGLIEKLRFGKPSRDDRSKSSGITAIKRNQKVIGKPVLPETFNSRLRTVHSYLSWRFTVELGRLSSTDAIFRRLEKHSQLIDKVFNRAYTAKSPESIGMHDALSDKQLEDFKKIITYRGSVAYGRHESVKYRNYICASIMLMYGLRPGELLSLRVEDVVFGSISEIRVFRRAADPLDVRLPRPSIKRAGRQLPIDSATFSRELALYISKHREILMDRGDSRDHDYLIVSDEGEPLHPNSLGQYFRIVRSKFSDILPNNLTAKMLRHTFSIQLERRLMEAGISEEDRVTMLMYWRGDTSRDSQQVYINAEIVRQGNAQLSRYHNDLIIPDF